MNCHGKNAWRYRYHLLLLIVAFSVSCGLFSQDSGPRRDQWQHPQVVMDALHIHPGSMVADVGAGDGYFTFHLAERVGPQGKVYAEDIKNDDVEEIRRLAKEKHLSQIEALHGEPGDPKLPESSLDVVLVMNAYHEFQSYEAMLQAIFNALKPEGILAIIDSPTPPGNSRSDYYPRHRIPEELVREDVAHAGFQFLRKEPGFTNPANKKDFYFLIFEKPRERAEISD
ncbi:MAG: methyltransferase domain-containing protein [Acidobacteriia bacterium]|nr:methyltransferase domain-containing protein [Terriglobia bacterium]